MNGLQRVARRAILARMKANAGLTALVPPTSLYSQTVAANPAWPFVKMGPPQSLPITAACLNGAEITVPVDAFAKDRYVSGQLVESAEDCASRIGGAIEAALHLRGETVDVDGAPARLRYTVGDMRLFPDSGEAGAFHYSAFVRARVVAE